MIKYFKCTTSNNILRLENPSEQDLKGMEDAIKCGAYAGVSAKEAKELDAQAAERAALALALAQEKEQRAAAAVVQLEQERAALAALAVQDTEARNALFALDKDQSTLRPVLNPEVLSVQA